MHQFQNLLIITNDPISRIGFHTILSNWPDFSITVISYEIFFSRFNKTNRQLDLLVLDLCSYYKNYKIIIEKIRKQNPGIPIIGLSIEWHINLARRFIEAGGSGILEKTSILQNFLEAVRLVLSGKEFIDQKIIDKITPFDSLTKREIEVINALVQADNQKEAAYHLNLTTRTFENHLKSIYNKTGVNNQKKLILIAAHYRLFDHEIVNMC